MQFLVPVYLREKGRDRVDHGDRDGQGRLVGHRLKEVHKSMQYLLMFEKITWIASYFVHISCLLVVGIY